MFAVSCVPELLTVTPPSSCPPSLTFGVRPKLTPDTKSVAPDAEISAWMIIGRRSSANAGETMDNTASAHTADLRMRMGELLSMTNVGGWAAEGVTAG